MIRATVSTGTCVSTRAVTSDPGRARHRATGTFWLLPAEQTMPSSRSAMRDLRCCAMTNWHAFVFRSNGYRHDHAFVQAKRKAASSPYFRCSTLSKPLVCRSIFGSVDPRVLEHPFTVMSFLAGRLLTQSSLLRQPLAIACTSASPARTFASQTDSDGEAQYILTSLLFFARLGQIILGNIPIATS